MGEEVVPDVDEGEFGFHGWVPNERILEKEVWAGVRAGKKIPGRFEPPGILLVWQSAYGKTSREFGERCQEVRIAVVFITR